MQRKLLAATVAAGPILALAFIAAPRDARAQTDISTATTAAVQTATAGNVTVTTTGTITLTTPGPMITLNSNNSVTVNGSISSSGVSDSTGVLVRGGNTGSVSVTSAISAISTLNPPDNDSDGDADGPLADGSNRFGIRVVGPGTFTGPITVNPGAQVLVSGVDSSAISIETGFNGNLVQSGTVNATGDRAYGVHVTGPLTGNLRIQGTNSAYGQGAVGVGLDSDINGAVVVQGSITGTGFRYQTRPVLSTDRAKLDADDLLIGGPAMRVSGNITGGLVLDVPPTLPTDLTTDANADGTLDYLVADSDGDGITDVNEGTAAIDSFGPGQALLIGSTSRAISLGAVGTGNLAYGFVNKGTITADGLFDGFAATGVQIGGLGFGVNIANGINNIGFINTTSYQANATGLLINSGVSAPALLNSGQITAQSTSDGVVNVRALSIQAGANVTSLVNRGSIAASNTGAKANVIAIEDLGGGITRLDNYGLITAGVVNTTGTVATGANIAIDARANTAGLTVHQEGALSTNIVTDTDKDGVDDGAEPTIYGDILFGSGADRLELANGSFNGTAAFGAGADTLSITGGASMIGKLTDSDGKLDITLGKTSTLAILNAETIRASSLNVTASDATLLFAADPGAKSSSKLVVGSATLANNVQLGMTLSSILDAPTRYTVIQAGSLSVGALGASLTGSPYFYISSASANTALGEVYVDVRPRTATELGFIGTQAQAYGSIIQALRNDNELARPLLVQNGREGLVRLYDQLLPDLGAGTFNALAYTSEQVALGVAQRPDPYDRYGPDSFWAQEINSLVRTETADTMGSDTQVFGFAGGYEAMGEYGGALGMAVAYMNVQERDNAAQVGERTNASVIQADLYWRRSIGGLRLTLGGGGGYGWLDADRRFFSGDLNGDGVNDLERDNSAKWNALTGHAFTSVGYEQGFGRFFVRPEGRLDYFYLNEGERKESGGGAGFDVTTQDRSSSALNAIASMTFGASFGRELWWRPEVRVGYRKQIAGSLGNTVASFAGGTPFTLAAADNKDGAVTLDMALRAGTPMSYVAVEGGVAAAKKQKRYNLRLAGRMMF